MVDTQIGLLARQFNCLSLKFPGSLLALAATRIASTASPYHSVVYRTTQHALLLPHVPPDTVRPYNTQQQYYSTAQHETIRHANTIPPCWVKILFYFILLFLYGLFFHWMQYSIVWRTSYNVPRCISYWISYVLCWKTAFTISFSSAQLLIVCDIVLQPGFQKVAIEIILVTIYSVSYHELAPYSLLFYDDCLLEFQTDLHFL